MRQRGARTAWWRHCVGGHRFRLTMSRGARPTALLDMSVFVDKDEGPHGLWQPGRRASERTVAASTPRCRLGCERRRTPKSRRTQSSALSDVLPTCAVFVAKTQERESAGMFCNVQHDESAAVLAVLRFQSLSEAEEQPLNKQCQCVYGARVSTVFNNSGKRGGPQPCVN
jgi:hypothetical protein